MIAVVGEKTIITAFKTVGAEILYECLAAPYKQICANADVDANISKCRGNIGFDAKNNRFVDMFAANIVDPAKVVKSALKNAVSVAGTLLTTEGTILYNRA